MQELKRVSVVPLKGTSDQDVTNYQRSKHGLASRSRTIETFLKRETLEGMVISLNQPNSKLNLSVRPRSAVDRYQYEPSVKRKVSRYLEAKIRRSPRQTLKCADLWSDAHCKNVMKQCNLTKSYFLEHHREICEKPQKPQLVSANTVTMMANSSLVMNTRKAQGLKKKCRVDMKSLLMTIAKRKQRQQVQKKEQNLYKDLSKMLTKKIMDYRVGIEQVSLEQFENLRRCQNYCHLVEKNLVPQYKFKSDSHGTASRLMTTRASTARSSRWQIRSSPTERQPKIAEKTTVQQNLQEILNRAEDLCSQLRKCSLRQELTAFEVYNQKLGTMMQSRAKSLARLRL